MDDSDTVEFEGGDFNRFPSLAGYEIFEFAGQDAFSRSYHARQLSLGRVVTIRTTRCSHAQPTETQWLQREAEMLCRLQHPHVVSLLDCVEQQGDIFLIMQHTGSRSLALFQQQLLTPVVAAETTAHVASTLDFVHLHGVTHCALTPANIFLAANDREPNKERSSVGAKRLADLGIPLLSGFTLAVDRERCQQLEDGMVFGVPRHLAPEQVEGRVSDLGPTTDVYGLGVMLYRLLTGHTPFDRGKDIRSLLEQIAAGNYIPIRTRNPGVDRRLARICHKCLSKQQSDRFPSAMALAEELRGYVDRSGRRKKWGF